MNNFEEEVRHNFLGIGEKNTDFAQYFVGESYRLPLVKKDGKVDVSVSQVSFAPGCRNNWHRHLGFQILIVTGGQGWYQEEGEPARLLKKGDVVKS